MYRQPRSDVDRTRSQSCRAPACELCPLTNMCTCIQILHQIAHACIHACARMHPCLRTHASMLAQSSMIRTACVSRCLCMGMHAWSHEGANTNACVCVCLCACAACMLCTHCENLLARQTQKAVRARRRVQRGTLLVGHEFLQLPSPAVRACAAGLYMADADNPSCKHQPGRAHLLR